MTTLGARQANFKSRWSFNKGLKRKPFSEQSKLKAHYLLSRDEMNTCMHCYLCILVVQSLRKPTTWYVIHSSWLYCDHINQVNGTVHAKSGSRWSCLADGHSTQGLFYTQSFMQGIPVIETRRSLNTGTVNGRFYCTTKLSWGWRTCMYKILTSTTNHWALHSYSCHKMCMVGINKCFLVDYIFSYQCKGSRCNIQ